MNLVSRTNGSRHALGTFDFTSIKRTHHVQAFFTTLTGLPALPAQAQTTAITPAIGQAVSGNNSTAAGVSGSGLLKNGKAVTRSRHGDEGRETAGIDKQGNIVRKSTAVIGVAAGKEANVNAQKRRKECIGRCRREAKAHAPGKQAAPWFDAVARRLIHQDRATDKAFNVPTNKLIFFADLHPLSTVKDAQSVCHDSERRGIRRRRYRTVSSSLRERTRTGAPFPVGRRPAQRHARGFRHRKPLIGKE